ncbi:putative chloride channel-like protein CLC-g [Hordeum vulgare]|nr:putative chloride channel-like protein CLC-g [Hordeum vulgare]
MVDDVSKIFDWQDGIGKVDYQKAMDAEKYEKKKEELEMEMKMKMENLRLAKEQKCILMAHADIIQNTRKVMKEMKVDRDILAQEKKELEKVVLDLLNDGHGSKEKSEKIKAILEALRFAQWWLSN